MQSQGANAQMDALAQRRAQLFSFFFSLLPFTKKPRVDGAVTAPTDQAWLSLSLRIFNKGTSRGGEKGKERGTAQRDKEKGKKAAPPKKKEKPNKAKANDGVGAQHERDLCARWGGATVFL